MKALAEVLGYVENLRDQVEGGVVPVPVVRAFVLLRVSRDARRLWALRALC